MKEHHDDYGFSNKKKMGRGEKKSGKLVEVLIVLPLKYFSRQNPYSFEAKVLNIPKCSIFQLTIATNLLFQKKLVKSTNKYLYQHL